MNDKTYSNNQSQDLDKLFARARASQPPLDDPAFLARVMRSITSARSETAESVATDSIPNVGSTFNWMDALGLGIGVVACFSFVEPAQLVAWVGNAVLPSKLVLSPVSLLLASLTMGGLALSGWWALEGSRRI